MRQDFIRLKVAEAMRDKGVTADDIAKVLGIPKGSTRSILLGRSGASEERWRIICTALGVDLDEIIQAEMGGRLPGICEVEEAWAALRSGENYTRLEILAEENSLSLRASAEPAPPEEELPQSADKPFGGDSGSTAPVPPVPDCGTGSEPKASLSREVDSPSGEDGGSSPLLFSPDELFLLLEGLTLTLHDAMSVYPERPDNMLDIKHMHRLTGLMLRLNAALEGGEEHAG